MEDSGLAQYASEEAQPEIGWELNKKHIFVLSSSGKPIYSRYGDEQDLVTTFGLLQAVISIVLDSGDCIKCIKAGKRRIVYYIKNSLYFIAISSTREPEAVLVKQLQFLYNQILLVLTSKVHDVFKNNPSADLRQLLGSDTGRLMQAACNTDITPTCIAFESVRSFICSKELRDDILFHLKHSVDKSGAVLGILLYKDSLINHYTNPATALNLSTPDILLLVHFVANSNSFRSTDQHWVPICLPEFNSKGYLQAYVCTLKVAAINKALVDFTLILVASAADPELFKELHRGRRYLEQTLVHPNISEKLLFSVDLQTKLVDKYLEPSMSMHFLYKYRPMPWNGKAVSAIASSSSSSSASGTIPPAQFIETSANCPLDNMAILESIWTHYQRLEICIRRGSCTVESTMFPLVPSAPGAAVSVRRSGTQLLEEHMFGISTRGAAVAATTGKSRPFMKGKLGLLSKSNTEASAGGGEGAEGEGDKGSEDAISCLPSADHALSYTVLSSGHVLVALATYDTELYVTYPGTVSPLDASTMADYLSRSLKVDSQQLFQVL